MSYEYIRGFGAEEDDDTFVLGVKVAGSQSGKGRRGGKGQQGGRSRQGGRRQQGGGQQQPQYSREERRARSQASCGGIECPDGLKSRNFIEEDNPIRQAEIQEGMERRGCSVLCAVGNSVTFCCPSAQTTQEVVTDPFAMDPTMLEAVETTIAERSATQPPEEVFVDEQNGSSPLKLVAILGVLGFGVTSFIGYMVFRRKRTGKKRKKGKS